ncbi:hypothetical protein GCM10022254_66730 [Actinomadura meridiana]|uniref:Uncharacterized protein n=1 Tax=Actinomadura meridiana TaxID=559626 RepID=A0ABP8CLZ7_9ACTN
MDVNLIDEDDAGCVRQRFYGSGFGPVDLMELTIRSYLATCTRNGLTMLEALTQLTHGQPWLPSAAH